MDCCEWALESAHCHCNSGCYTVDRKSTRLNSSHSQISYAVFCLKKKKNNIVTNIESLNAFLQSAATNAVLPYVLPISFTRVIFTYVMLSTRAAYVSITNSPARHD